MKLYYSAGACSTSCHISLEESGLKYEAVEVDWDNPNDPNLVDAMKRNPLGTLPILVTDDGKQLDQNLSIHIHIADLAPHKNLLPAHGTFERTQAFNWLSFVASDFHKSVGAMFTIHKISKDKEVRDQVRSYMKEEAVKYLKYLDSNLVDKPFILGKHFSVVDSYAYVVLTWTKFLQLPLDSYQNLPAYMARVEERPAVAKVIREEGLDK